LPVAGLGGGQLRGQRAAVAASPGRVVAIVRRPVWAARSRGMNVPAKRELAAQLAPRHPSELEARCLAAKVPGFLMVQTGEAWRPAGVRLPRGRLRSRRRGERCRGARKSLGSFHIASERSSRSEGGELPPAPAQILLARSGLPDSRCTPGRSIGDDGCTNTYDVIGGPSLRRGPALSHKEIAGRPDP
jgi:hypothetical protein